LNPALKPFYIKSLESKQKFSSELLYSRRRQFY